MKNVFLAIAILFSASMFAQEKEGKMEKEVKMNVPAVVKTAFAKDFSGKKAKWEMENDNFEAEFKMDGNNASAVYDKTGHKMEVEQDIKTKDLPASTLAYLKANYSKNKINEAAKITNDKNEVTYEAELSEAGKSFDVLFTEKGEFIKVVGGN
jgi:hypothetical protein